MFEVKYSKVNTYLYSASLQSACNTLPLPVRRRRSPQASSPARHQQTLRDHRYGLVHHAICLFTPSFCRVLVPAYPQRAGSGWVGLGAWFEARLLSMQISNMHILALKHLPNAISVTRFFVHIMIMQTTIYVSSTPSSVISIQLTNSSKHSTFYTEEAQMSKLLLSHLKLLLFLLLLPSWLLIHLLVVFKYTVIARLTNLSPYDCATI